MNIFILQVFVASHLPVQTDSFEIFNLTNFTVFSEILKSDQYNSLPRSPF